MPAFDGYLPAPSPVTPVLSEPHARLTALAEWLELDPVVRKRWDFNRVWSECGAYGCALGWAQHRGLIGEQMDDDRLADWAAREFGVDPVWAGETFVSGHGGYGKRAYLVTPDDVAARIRSHLCALYPEQAAALQGART